MNFNFKSGFIFMMLGLVTANAFSDHITVQGEVSGEWTADTVMVIADLTILNGQSLLVQPGTVVIFQGSYAFNIQGSIQAIGTVNDSIEFTVSDTSGFSTDTIPGGGWRGIRFDSTRITNPVSVFQYCRFNYAKNASQDTLDGNGGTMRVVAYDGVSVENCYFSDNFATYNGGAISLDSAGIAIHDCVFTRNRCGLSVAPWGYGGAISSDRSGPDIRRNVFTANSSTGIGGAVSVRFKDCDIYNNIFSGNYSALGGALGVLHIPECTHRINTNLIAENAAEFFGGGVASINASPYYINNTIAFNTAIYGGGFYCKDSVSPDFYNTIIWGNIAAVGNQGYLFEVYSQADFFFCDVEGGPGQFGGSGGGEAFFGAFESCIDENPQFQGNGDHPYELTWDSPCYDAGSPDTSGFFLPEYDLAGNPRHSHGFVDMGAYEVVWVGLEDEEQESGEEGKWGRGEEGKGEMMDLYPNPTRGVFGLQSSVLSRQSAVGGQQSAVIEIVDVFGNVPVKFNCQLPTANCQLNISHLPDGIYFVRIIQGVTIIPKKLVKVSR